jgi:xylulose-5-phosphate/fructose-6-phosphate phosphoketolase
MLLGHWGTTPGQNFIYAHLNRVIKKYDLDMIYVSGPGHGGPAVVGNTYLEGTYSEIYPDISQDEAGLRSCSCSSRFPAAFPATPRRSARARSTRAASWAIRSAIRSARCSTIPT